MNANCIEAAQDIPDHTQTSYTTIGQISDSEQLMTGLSISAGVQAKALFGSIDAKVKYVTSQNVNTETMTLAVYSSVINGTHFLGIPSDKASALKRMLFFSPKKSRSVQRAPLSALNLVQTEAANSFGSSLRLKPEYETLYKKPDKKDFYTACGTHYVAAFREGAEIVGFLKTSSLSVAEKNSLDVALSGSYFGQSASSDVQSTLNKTSAIKNFNIDIRKSGGWDSPQATDQAGLLTAIRDLSHDAAIGPKRFQLLASSYSRLMHDPEPPDPNAVALRNLMTRYWRFLSLQGDFLWIDAHRPDYVFNWGISYDAFDRALAGVQAAIKNVRNTSSDCYLKQSCPVSLVNVPTTFDFRPFLPLKKRQFDADVNLRDSAMLAQAAVAQYNAKRDEQMDVSSDEAVGCDNFEFNNVFCSWSEPAWLNGVWPLIAAFERNLQTYPGALKFQIAETRMSEPWRGYCKPDGADVDCIPLSELRSREAAIQVSGHTDIVNGNGVFPGGDATKCGYDVHAIFDPKID